MPATRGRRSLDDVRRAGEIKGMVNDILYEFIGSLVDELTFDKEEHELISDKSKENKHGVFIKKALVPTSFVSLLTKSSTKVLFTPRKGKYYIEPLAESDPNYYSVKVRSADLILGLSSGNQQDG